MPLDTFICGTCQDTFTDLNDFVLHKKNCLPGQADLDGQAVMTQSRGEIIQLHMNESGEITGLSSEPMGERDLGDDRSSSMQQLVFLADVSMESELGRASMDDSGIGENSTSGPSHLIILNRSIPDLGVKTETPNGGIQETDQLISVQQNQTSEILSPLKKKRPGRSKTGEGKTKVLEAVPPTIPRPTVPETNPDGKLACPQCKRTFTKERHFITHKCLASSSYVDISKKEIVKIDSEEEDETADLELDAGACDDEGDEFNGALDDDREIEKEDENDEKEMEKGNRKQNEEWTWKNKKGKKRKRSSYKFEVDTHFENSGAKQMKVAAEAMENLPIFKNEEEKSDFEACIDVDLSQVDSMFRIHIIEQELNELSGLVYNTPTMSSLSVYLCNYCNKVFKSLSHIRLHCVTHTDMKPFKCNKCKYTTNSKGNLYTHMRKHTGQFYRCDQCEFKTVNKSHLVEHQMTHDNRRSKCMMCQKDYSTLKSLINHIRKYHTDKKGKEYLQTFLQGRGSKEATVFHQCHVCNRKFKKRLDRDRHLLVHDIKDLPHVQQCELCDYWASRRVYLDKHYLKHRVIYCCAVCDQKFLSTTRLTEHLTASHTNESGDFVSDNLLEECISRSLYLPEPLSTTSEGSKYVNLPEELREPEQHSQSAEESKPASGSKVVLNVELNLAQESPTGGSQSACEQSSDFVSEYRKFINVAGVDRTWKGQMSKDSQIESTEDVLNSIQCDIEESVTGCSFTAQKEVKREQMMDPQSLSLMMQTPESEVDEDVENKVPDNENIEDERVADVGGALVKADATKEEKIEALIKRLGYRNMTMQIFNKMRETFGTEECEFCGRLFYSKVDYEPHLRTHTGDKPFACSSCSFRGTTKDQLKKHSEKEHEKVAFQCKECDFLAPTRTRLWNHQLKHLGISGLSCPQCPHKFEGMKQLRAHILNTHKEMDRETVEKLTGYRHKPFGKMGRRSFKCPHCPRVFIRANSELQKHIWIHEGIKPFSCPLCPYACRSKNNLQAHMLRHSAEKPFSCSECGKDYKSKTALRWHVRSHKSGKLFKCDKCPYEATQKSHLKRHMETHDVLKRFICKHCDFSANTLGYMKIHYAKNHKGKEFVHDEIVDPTTTMSPEKRVFKCLSCGYLFGNLSDLKRHLKIRHHIQMQDIAGMEQMQISEVEIVQCEEEFPDGQSYVVSKHHQESQNGQSYVVSKHHQESQNGQSYVVSKHHQESQAELQLQIPHDDGSLSVSAANLLQLIGMSQGGEAKVRVVNENGEPLDISVHQEGHLVFANGNNGASPERSYIQGGEAKVRVVNENGEPLDISVHRGHLVLANGNNETSPESQFIIHYYNSEQMASNVCDSSSDTRISMLPAGSQEESQVGLSEEVSHDAQFISTQAVEAQVMTADGDLQSMGVHSQDVSDHMIATNGEGLLVNPTGQFVHAESNSYNSQLMAEHNAVRQALSMEESSLMTEQDQLTGTGLDIVERSVH